MSIYGNNIYLNEGFFQTKEEKEIMKQMKNWSDKATKLYTQIQFKKKIDREDLVNLINEYDTNIDKWKDYKYYKTYNKYFNVESLYKNLSYELKYNFKPKSSQNIQHLQLK